MTNIDIKFYYALSFKKTLELYYLDFSAKALSIFDFLLSFR